MIRAMVRGCIGGLLALSLLAGACSDDEPDTSAVTSIPDDASSTTTTTEPETVAPDVIPDDESLITEDYVEGVLNALETADHRAFLVVREEGVVGQSAIQILNATGTERDAARGINGLADLAREGFPGYAPNPKPAKFLVKELLKASQTCVLAVVEVDSSSYFIEPPADPPPGRTVVELLPATSSQRESGHNPTAWVVDSIPVIADGDELPDCEASA
jgi:hypothetical protein